MSYFGPLLNQRLTELDDALKQSRYQAGCNPWSPAWEHAETIEEAIKAKLAEQNIKTPAPGQAWYFSPVRLAYVRSLPVPLAYLIPDAERVYLTQAERKAIILEGSEYLRRHPEMAEEFLSPDDAYALTRGRKGEESLCPVYGCGRLVGDCPHAEGL